MLASRRHFLERRVEGGDETYPVLLSLRIGDTQIVLQAYGAFQVIAWVVSLAMGALVARRRGLGARSTLIVLAGALAVGMVGARVLDLGINWAYYSEDTSRVYDLGFRGFALHGGLGLAAVTAALLARALDVHVWKLADSVVPALATGLVLMRAGCLLNGCCFGKVTSLPWGITYPPGSPAWTHQFVAGESGTPALFGLVLPVHPTQVYEMVAAVIMGAIAVWLMPRRGPGGRPSTPSGVPFLVFALGFTAFRACIHLLRAQPFSVTSPVWLYPSFYALICVGMAFALRWRMRFTHATREAPPSAS